VRTSDLGSATDPARAGDTYATIQGVLQVDDTRLDAQLQAVNAHLIEVDSRLAKIDRRVDDLDQRLDALTRRTEARFRTTDNRLDATRTHIDHVRLQLSSQIDHARRDLGRIVLMGLLGTTVSTAGLCLGTIILLL
jgi:septal ring factor EnvC (AmiA/AmiB activator)